MVGDLNIVCLNSGNYLERGKEYVEILFDMVRRNLSKETKYRFTCFTDDADEYESGIWKRPLPVDGLAGWWNKISLFKDGLFLPGERIFYIDLDTVITGDIGKIVAYNGPFAMLRDFFRPEAYGSGIMSWKAGEYGYLWDDYVKAGQPMLYWGDQEWIEKTLRHKPDIWQDLFPEAFVSYRMDAIRQIPPKSKIIAFHGYPKNHEITDGWMPHVWKIGGGSMLELVHHCNTVEQKIVENIQTSLKRGFPWLRPEEAHDGHAVIVGGGPSLKNHLVDILERQRHGQIVFATNNTWNWLYERGIEADCHMMVDARPENADFVPVGNPLCYYSSQCAQEVFQKAKDKKIILWHSLEDGIQHYIGDNTGDPLVGGGSTIGLKSIAIAHILGYRNFHLYGFDSSYSDGKNHAYPQQLNDDERIIEVQMNGKKYKVAPWMAYQVEQFKVIAKELVDTGCTITIHGTGLLPDAAKLMQSTAKEAA